MLWNGCAVERQRGDPSILQTFSQFPSSRCVQAANSDSNFLAGEKQLSSEVRLKGPTLKQMDRGDTAVVQELHRRTPTDQLPRFWEFKNKNGKRESGILRDATLRVRPPGYGGERTAGRPPLRRRLGRVYPLSGRSASNKRSRLDRRIAQ